MTQTCPALFSAHDNDLITLPREITQLRDARNRAQEHLWYGHHPPPLIL